MCADMTSVSGHELLASFIFAVGSLILLKQPYDVDGLSKVSSFSAKYANPVVVAEGKRGCAPARPSRRNLECICSLSK